MAVTRARLVARLLSGVVLVVGAAAAAPFAAAQAVDAADEASRLKRMSLEELMDLVVTSASRAPEPFGQAAAAIQVITRDQIRRSGATTIAEALRLATNLTVAQKNAHTWAISARGFNTDLSNKLLVLIDGRTVYTPLFSGVFWDRQDYLLEDVERIEVISGPGGSLWGANAVNGVINIITRSAGESRGLYASGGAGSAVRGIAGLRWGGALGENASFRLYGKWFERDEEALPDGTDGKDEWGQRQGGFRLDSELGASDRLTVQGDAYGGERNKAEDREGTVHGGNVLARWVHTFSETSQLSAQGYWDLTHLSLPTPDQFLNGTLASPAGTLTDDLHTYDLDLQHRFAAGARNRFVWGGGIRFMGDEVGNAPGLAFEPASLDRTLLSGFVQDEIGVTSALTLTLGSKVEHNDYTGVEVEPSARLRLSTSPSHTLWAAVSRAVRTPSRVDVHERLPTPGFAPVITNLLAANDRFVSETVIAYEAGWRAQIGSAVAGSLSAFYNEYDDLRSTSLSPPNPLPFPLFFANDLEATTYGAEVAANLRPVEGWGLRLGYAYLHEDVRVREGGQDFNNALNETADPKHQLFAQSSWDVGSSVDLDAALRWIGSFEYGNAGVAQTVPSYAELDARFAWRPVPRVEVSVDGRNLLHDRHLEYVVSPPNPRQEITRSVQLRVALRR